MPAGGSCSFSPATVTPGSSPATTTMTITTVAGEAAAASRHSSAFWAKFSGGVVLALLLWPARRARRWPIAMVLGLLIGSLALSGCGSSRLVPPQTYTVTVTGTGGGVTQTSEVILTVQN
jgi:hypothetical protein